MSDEEPIPCGHCGEDAKAYGDSVVAYQPWRLCRVQCRNCGVGTGNYPTREQAIAAWNRRAPMTPNDDWTPVTEGLPTALDANKEGEVLAHDNGGEMMSLPWESVAHYQRNFGVVAWRPLPEPWRGEGA